MGPITNVALKKKFRESLVDYTSWWKHVDSELRGVVSNHSGTNQVDLYVNVVMVDAVYRSQLARSLREDNSVAVAAAGIYQDRAAVMTAIQALPRQGSLTTAVLPDIVRAHRRVVNAIAGAGASGYTVRSFASKFLHFYSGVVPIYDSLASQRLSEYHYSWRQFKNADPTMAALEADLTGDTEYIRFVLRFLSLTNLLKILEPRRAVNSKTIDHMLWRG